MLLSPGKRRFLLELHGRAKSIEIDEIALKVLPLERIIVSKRAAGRSRDLAQIPALEEALAVLKEKPSEDQ